jgi:hypothetical protein
MANVFYSHGIYDITHGTIDWVSDSFKVVLVDTSLYTLNQISDQYLSSIPVGARVATSSVLTGKSMTGYVADADDVTISLVTGSIGAIAIFKDTGNPNTSPLIIYIDSTDVTLPMSISSQDFNIIWSNGSSKIFKYDPTYTVLLHGDALIGGAEFVDETGVIWSNSYVLLDTVNKVFGPGSIKAQGGTPYSSSLGTASSLDFNFGTSNFTIDFRMKTTASVGFVLCNLDGDNGPLTSTLYIGCGSGFVEWRPIYDGTHVLDTSGVNPCDGTWHHIACVRYGDIYTIYVDGTARAQHTWGGLNINNYGNPVWLGRAGAQNNYWVGNVDELRISNGTVRYTGDFTPSLVPYNPNIVGSPSLSSPGILSLPFVPPATVGSIIHLLDDFEVGTLDYTNVTKSLAYSWGITVLSGSGSKEGIDEAARFVFRPEERIKLFPGRILTEEPIQEQAAEWIS